MIVLYTVQGFVLVCLLPQFPYLYEKNVPLHIWTENPLYCEHRIKEFLQHYTTANTF